MFSVTRFCFCTELLSINRWGRGASRAVGGKASRTRSSSRAAGQQPPGISGALSPCSQLEDNFDPNVADQVRCDAFFFPIRYSF